MKHTSYFVISLLLLMLVPMTSFSQEETTQQQDTLVYKQKYGLRLGADIYRPIRSFIDEEYTGFEINGDYRLTKSIYLAGELGTEQRSNVTDYLDVTAKGSYFKAGVDYNFYQNWLDMENMIYGGFRVGVSSFSQTLNSYTVYNTDPYYDDPFTSDVSQEFKGLSAIWAEIIFGMKVEVINNIYVGANVQLKGRITETKPENFANLYIPGFNKVFDSGRFGIGFGYNVSYLIPIYKKDKKVAVEKNSN
ncbi:DUF6048 family protein [Subsaxibacter sp. CAU 1640]|uniref:DUF6048 family protein n=1 Tax=Subsaxibacter sp. CAU 1640 TaxID=2933271 RepID=UPI0020063668|nr:DUF6048 family protein [Subsaxibacter sp. CAU 1640]MCK7590454.1 DUF6048 family protein [Subsaxibacter sp. CAU 1640]